MIKSYRLCSFKDLESKGNTFKELRNFLSGVQTFSREGRGVEMRIIYKEIHSESDARNLQQDLEAAARWEQDWLMCFHPDKCNVLSITQKQKYIKFTYKLHGHSLEKTDSTKYLGITLQSNLKWDKHINNITSKANQTLGFLRRN